MVAASQGGLILAGTVYVTLLANRVDALAEFYRQLFGLEEIEGARSDIVREFLIGGGKLRVAHWDAYAMLGLFPTDGGGRPRQALSFNVGARRAVGPKTEEAVGLGARLVEPACDAALGGRQSVLLDIEGNLLRIGALI